MDDALFLAADLGVELTAPRHPRYRFAVLSDSGDAIESTLLPPGVDVDEWGLQAARLYFPPDHPTFAQLPPASSLYDEVFAFYDGQLPVALRDIRAWARRFRRPGYDGLPKMPDGLEPLLLIYDDRLAEIVDKERRGRRFSLEILQAMDLARSGHPV